MLGQVTQSGGRVIFFLLVAAYRPCKIIPFSSHILYPEPETCLSPNLPTNPLHLWNDENLCHSSFSDFSEAKAPLQSNSEHVN